MYILPPGGSEITRTKLASSSLDVLLDAGDGLRNDGAHASKHAHARGDVLLDLCDSVTDACTAYG